MTAKIVAHPRCRSMSKGAAVAILEQSSGRHDAIRMSQELAQSGAVDFSTACEAFGEIERAALEGRNNGRP